MAKPRKQDTVKAIADRITQRLFTNGAGEQAERLVLELPGKRDGGGWCRDAVLHVIREEMSKEF